MGESGWYICLKTNLISKTLKGKRTKHINVSLFLFSYIARFISETICQKTN